jgi:hypothetical protein
MRHVREYPSVTYSSIWGATRDVVAARDQHQVDAWCGSHR